MKKKPLSILNFTQNADVINAVQDVQEYIARKIDEDPKFSYSDIVDGEGNWYVDLVQEGGGVLGIALVGYTYVLEQAGLRFLNLGGTSAGAINTLLLAAADIPQNPKSEKILSKLKDLDFLEFIDGRKSGDKSVREFIESLISLQTSKRSGFLKKLRVAYEFLGTWDDLRNEMGLNRGHEFEEWLQNVLHSPEFGNISTLQQLVDKMETLPTELKRFVKIPTAEDRQKWPLAIIAADITTETKAVFPRDAYLYTLDPMETNPSEFVRASMSVPLFFYPKTFNVPYLEDLDAIFQEDGTLDLKTKKERYERLVRGWREDKEINVQPEEAILVDGGIISNFPIDVFHISDRAPSRPTFGVKLGFEREGINTIKEGARFKSAQLFGIIFETARLARDRDFIKSNPDFNKLVAYIDTADHYWLNFFLSDEDKVDLFARGARAARDFLLQFDWDNYKKIRKQLLLQGTRNILDATYQNMLTDALNKRKQKANAEGTVYKVSLEDPDSSVVREWKKQLEILSTRISMIKLRKDVEATEEVFRVLWIDDECKEDEYFKANELQFIKETIGAEVETATSSTMARSYLELNNYHYDLIISDIKRGSEDESPSESEVTDIPDGIVFLNELVGKVDSGEVISLPPVIFYISNLDRSRGIPAYAFGITNQITELMHLVADVYERRGLYRYITPHQTPGRGDTLV